ncbi:YusW family protein [Geomicrobium sp. JSM 1781026]|uniref:YusW family protein n=1 Tax=unclassified Geomicrobium TaxID=2628951 RepID=UPI0012681715|nr:YusW family protein [Geomicrobium sp. JCM 19037]
MKRSGLLSIGVICLMGVAGCQDSGEANVSMNSEPSTQENASPVQQPTEQSEGTAWYDQLSFQDFELDAGGASGKYEVDFDYDDGVPEADIEDERQTPQIELGGQAALDQLASLLPELAIEQASTPEQIQAEVERVFQLDPNEQYIEIEILFHDGTKINI